MRLFYLLAFLLCCCCFSVSTLAQDTNITVKGAVKSADTDEGLPGVTITVRGTLTGTITDAQGNYTVSAPRNGSVVFSFVGFNSQEIAIRDRGLIDVKLETDTRSLGELVVVGYTTQSKVKITAATSKLNTEELVNTTNPNPVQAMQGKIAGVSIPINSGQPGAGAANIIIRGGQS